MKPMLSIKVIDGDTGITLDKVDRWIAPTRSDYEFVDDEILYRTYRWKFAYTIADDYALTLEEKMEKVKGVLKNTETVEAIPIGWIEMFMHRYKIEGDNEYKLLHFMVTEWKKWEKENEARL